MAIAIEIISRPLHCGADKKLRHRFHPTRLNHFRIYHTHRAVNIVRFVQRARHCALETGYRIERARSTIGFRHGEQQPGRAYNHHLIINPLTETRMMPCDLSWQLIARLKFYDKQEVYWRETTPVVPQINCARISGDSSCRSLRLTHTRVRLDERSWRD